jgi:hypothetical protein
MARIKIHDLPENIEISSERMKSITGGFSLSKSWLDRPFLKHSARASYPLRFAINNTDTGRFAIANTDMGRFAIANTDMGRFAINNKD